MAGNPEVTALSFALLPLSSNNLLLSAPLLVTSDISTVRLYRVLPKHGAAVKYCGPVSVLIPAIQALIPFNAFDEVSSFSFHILILGFLSTQPVLIAMSTTGYIPREADLYSFVEGLHSGNLNLSVHTGFWHDYTREGIRTGTLTLSTRSSGFLLAALVTFIGIVGASFWSLLSFVLHQLRAKNGEEDGLYFQEQVILRNSGSALQAVCQFWRVSWAWRDRRAMRPAPQRLRSRFFFLSLPPLLILIGFTTAGIFVADIIRSGYRVDNLKIDPVNCGSLEMEPASVADFATAYPALTKLNSKNMQAAKVYTRECYETTIKSPACGLYPQKSLPFVQANVPCPFGHNSKGNSVCTFDSSLNLDTGLLDTNAFLGINAPAKNRVLFRLSSTCSPINDTEFATRRDQSISENSTIWDFYFGRANYPNGDNYTYDTSTTRFRVPYQLQ